MLFNKSEYAAVNKIIDTVVINPQVKIDATLQYLLMF